MVAAKREESLKVPRSTVEHRETRMRALQDFIRELFQGCKVYVFAFGCGGIRGRKNSAEEYIDDIPRGHCWLQIPKDRGSKAESFQNL